MRIDRVPLDPIFLQPRPARLIILGVEILGSGGTDSLHRRSLKGGADGMGSASRIRAPILITIRGATCRGGT